MAAEASPGSISERSHLSTGQSTSPSRKRKRYVNPTPTTREYGFMRDTGERDSARFVGSSSGIHFIRNVHVRLARQSANRAHQGDIDEHGDQLTELVPGEDDQLRKKNCQKDGEASCIWKDDEIAVDDDSVPTFDQLVKWSKSYFESWHPILPFLHGPEVLRIFEDASKSGVDSLHHLDRSILRAVLSICLADSRQGTSMGEKIPSSLLFRNVDEAVSSSQFALNQPASIRATQAALSIQLFLISMLCLNAASRLGGLIVRMAFHLGLHRCPTRFPFFTGEEAARRRRVFWCLYCCERFLSQSLGLPLDIRDDDVDVCYPGEEIHGNTHPEDGNDKRLLMLKFMAKHAKIRGLILELRNKSITVRQDTAERAIAVQTELAKWSNEIQDTVEEGDFNDGTDGGSDSGISASHRLILLVSKYESKITLNRPMMASDPSSPQWSSAMQACISAAKSICITIRKYSTRQDSAAGQSGRTWVPPLLWPAFIWATWISAFILAYAAFEEQMPLESVVRHIESCKDALRHLAARDTSWPEYCLSAIDELISAVKELSKAETEGSRRSGQLLGAGHDVDRNTSEWVNRDSAPGQPTFGSGPTVPLPLSASGSGQRPPFLPRSGDQQQRDALEWRYGQQFNPPPGTPQAAWSDGNGQAQVQVPGNFESAVIGNDMSQLSGEGQESMLWYDRLFDSSFSAIDNPFLAAAQFDSSIDPTWSYLR